MKSFKRFLAALLVIVTLVGILPVMEAGAVYYLQFVGVSGIMTFSLSDCVAICPAGKGHPI